MRKWTDYPGRKNLAAQLMYWAGRDKWVCEQYRNGRMLAAWLIRDFRAQLVTPGNLENVVTVLGRENEYYRLGAVTLLNAWFAAYGQQHAA